jgi:predicted RNase H-like HicB family nuclease
MEIVFSVTQEADGGFVAECLTHDIFTQGDTWEQLRQNVQEAVSAYFFDQNRPDRVRLHLVREELLA